VTVYAKSGCHLCADAEAAIKREFPKNRLTRIDIDGRDALEFEYSMCIPVVIVNGKIVSEGPVGTRELRRIRQSLNQMEPGTVER